MRCACAAALGIAACVGVACGLSQEGSGASSADAAAGTDGTAPVDGTVLDSGPDTAADGGVPEAGDAPIEVSLPDGCSPVDCTNPACMMNNYACSPPVPSGWNLVALTTGASCPSGYGGPTPVAESPDASTTCPTCTCGAPAFDPCAQGTVSVSLGVAFCACPNYQSVNLTVDGGCNTLQNAVPGACLANWGSGAVTPPGTMASCAATNGSPSPPTYSTATLCTPGGVTFMGCPGTQECAPKPGGGAKLCVAIPGASGTCPPGFGMQHVLYPVSGLQDTRACGGCACGLSASACQNPTFTFYADSACTRNPVGIKADGNCHGFNPNNDPTGDTSYQYTATPVPCGVTSPSTMSGSFTASGPMFVCCM